jgi:hypothetical protein
MSFECPVGCGAGPFSTKNGAVMHALNKSDETHEPITDKPTAYERLESNRQTADGSETRPETDETQSDENPLFGSDGSEPETQTDASENESDSSDELVCPECGGEIVDFTQYTAGQYHTVNGQNVFVRGDYVCSECRGWFVDE